MQIESPSNDLVNLEIDQTFQAARATLRPHDFKGPNGSHIGGHFRAVLTTGATTGIAAGGPMLSLRWTNQDRALLINRIKVGVTVGTVFAAAQEVSVDLARVTSMVNPDTGGTAITLAESGRKSRANMAVTQVADLRVSIAAALGLGASTVEEAPMCGTLMKGMLNAVGSMADGILFDIEAGHEGPIVIQRNEGFRIRNRTAMGAGGVLVFTFDLDWSEVPTALLGA